MSVLSVISMVRYRKQEYCCDSCGAVLSEQEGFDPKEDEWVCTECGSVKPANDDHMFDSLN